MPNNRAATKNASAPQKKTGHSTEVQRRPFGSTGENVSVIGLGGSHIGYQKLTNEEAVRLIRSAIDNGINFMDNCWDYNSGRSELRMGRALQDGYRKRVFLMTKVDDRTRHGALRQLDDSLRRLQTDHIDLLQFHEVIRWEDVDRIFAPGGALEGFLAAQQAGKIRYIGFTGHKDPHIHLYMLETAKRHGFKFDAVQMPLNVMDAHYRSFGKRVLPRLVEENIAVLAMKTIGDGVILKSNLVTAVECLRYALSLPVTVAITGIDSADILEQALEVGRHFEAFSEEEIRELLARTESAAADGRYELFKTSAHFDSTAAHPNWLGEELPYVEELAAV